MNKSEKQIIKELRKKLYKESRKNRMRERKNASSDYINGTWLLTGTAAKLVMYVQEVKSKRSGVKYSKQLIIQSLLMELYESKYRCIIERCEEIEKAEKQNAA